MKKIDTKKYANMGIFAEAKQRNIDGMGYHAERCHILWQSKKVSWQHIMIFWGIRWSDKWQKFPIWNMSDNCHRALMFGFWKLYFTISYARAKNCHYLFKMPFFRQLRKIYLLLG